MIAYQQLNFGLKSKNIMLIEIVAYSLIALQIPLVLCRSQSQNPYYNSYLQNQHRGDTDNLNTCKFKNVVFHAVWVSDLCACGKIHSSKLVKMMCTHM